MTIEMSNIPQERPFISFNEMFDYRFKYNPNGNLVTFAVPANKEEGGDELAYETTTFSQYEQYLNWTAYMLAKHFPPRKRGQPIRIIALITGTDLDSFVNLHALFRLGHGVLILSPNNSIEGMIHLTKKMCCTDVIFSLENQEIAQALKRTYQEQEDINLFTTSWVMVKDIKHQSAPPPQLIRTELSYEEESKDFSTILHSSGSTNLPKPLPMSHKAWLNHLFGKDFGGTSIYPFNHFSGTQTLFLSFQNLRETILMSSRVPYTSSNLVKIIKNALEGGSQQLLCVPLTLKLLSEISNGINLLAKFQLVSYAGSVCPKPLGDHLIENGVNLQTFYGATETGLCLSTFRDFERDKGWDIMRPIKEIIPFARWEEQEDDPGMYELVIEKGFPSLSAANRPDGAYATSDLFTRHPTMPNGFYYASRKDDSLVHVHGKKTNPLLIETDLRSSSLIKDAMVFGANRMQTGCLIIPQSDDLTLEDLRDAIDFANKRAPTWSRLENEMVIVLPSSEKFVMTDKLSLIRAKTNKRFEDLIEEKYNNVEGNLKGQEVEKVKLVTLTQALSVVQTIVSEVMKAQITHLGSIKEDDNLFDKGLDSLAVMRIGSLIRSRVEFPLGIEANETAAFHHPTIRTLAEYLYRLSSGANQQNENDENAHSLNLMRRLLNEYTERIETRSASTVAQVKNGKETILLTGATGSLGAHLFSIAAKRQDVEAIICLCRAKTDEEALERVNASLAERRLPAIQHFASNCKVFCLSSDLADAHLGLAPEMYQTVLQSVTSIVHAAWPVNFSMGVSAFESSLQGCVNLINLASKSSLAHPPQLIFCSSIAAAASLNKYSKGQNAVMEEPSIDPKDAVPNGYGRSKWIAEALFDAAAIKITNLNSKIIRIGQLSGDLQNGVWNEKEAYPLLIKTAQTIGSLPDLSNQQLFWLPVDIAAEMIVEVSMQKKDERGIRIVHVASKEVTNWNSIVLAVRHAYPKVRQVPFVKWLEELRTAKDQNPKSNPAIKLLDYYATWLNMKQGGIPRFDTAYVNNLLTDKPQILKHSGALSQDNLTKMILAWQQNGFLFHA